MGFLSKLMKNPLMQMALPFALSAVAGPAGAALTKGGLGAKLFGNMSPLMANALKQSALGFGTAALSGSKRPWKGAMYAGLTSIPFSYMSAANAANAFNQEYAGVVEPQRFLKSTTPLGTQMQDVDFKGVPHYGMQRSIPIQGPPTPNYQFRNVPVDIPKLSAWDIATGRGDALKDIISPRTIADQYYDASKAAGGEGYTRTLAPPGSDGKYMYTKLAEGKPMELPGAGIFTKTTPVKGGYNKAGDLIYSGGETVSDWLPTAASQAAALYGGRMTPEEEWEASRKKRKKELAWMYGVDEDQIEGEMDNPWYGGGGYWNKGGIASLENGGGVNGPGTGTSDSIDAKLSDGEFVMTAKAVENLGRGDRYEGARKMYGMMNMLDPESETMSEVI